MGSLSIWHWVLVILVVVLLFGVGKGKIPAIMGDLGKGLRSFKDGLTGSEDKTKQEVLPPTDKKDT